jgi:adenylate kinase family enzyme
MRTVSVVGVSGNGKTTLSRRLAVILGVPYTELDRLNHLRGWTEATDQQLRSAVTEAIDASEGWVLDGGYMHKLGDLILLRADTVVWLDQALPLLLRRLFIRTVKDIFTQRDLFNGNRQTWRFAFVGRDSLFRHAIRMHFRYRRDWPALFKSYPDLLVVRLRSPRAVEMWLEEQAKSLAQATEFGRPKD